MHTSPPPPPAALPPHHPSSPPPAYTAAGFFLSTGDVGSFRHAEGASLNASIHTPSSALYVRDGAAAGEAAAADGSAAAGDTAAAGGSSGSGLSAGAIAGIAVGSVAVAAGLVLVGWAMLRRRCCRSITSGRLPSGTSGGVSKSRKPSDGTEEDTGGAFDSQPTTQSTDQLTAMRQQLGGLDPAVEAAAGLAPGLAGPARASPRQSCDLCLGGTLGSPRSSSDSRYATGAPLQISRPVAASPFAAAAARLSQRHLDVGPTTPSSGLTSPGTAADLSEEVQELLRHRAQQEAAELAATTGSGGTGGTAASRSTPSGSSTPPASTVFAALPASLSSWVLPRAEVEYQHRPDGSLHVLGAGAR